MKKNLLYGLLSTIFAPIAVMFQVKIDDELLQNTFTILPIPIVLLWAIYYGIMMAYRSYGRGSTYYDNDAQIDVTTVCGLWCSFSNGLTSFIATCFWGMFLLLPCMALCAGIGRFIGFDSNKPVAVAAMLSLFSLLLPFWSYCKEAFCISLIWLIPIAGIQTYIYYKLPSLLLKIMQ